MFKNKIAVLSLLLVFVSEGLNGQNDLVQPASEMDSLDHKIGQMILMGISDRKELKDTDLLIGDLKAGKLGGVVLFEKNISVQQSVTNLKTLIDDLQKYSSSPLWISIDEEGGKVHRLKEKYGFVAMPSAAFLGKLNQPDTTYYYYKRLAQELRLLGINLNFAPSVDMAVNPENKVIVKNMRSFSAFADTVILHAKVCILAHRISGVSTVIKHFPGHGSSTGDSHYGIVDISKSWNEAEMIPFSKLIETGFCDGLMTAHIIHNAFDSLPATLSYNLIQNTLRVKMKYNGVVFSDDMQMHAISRNYGMEEAICLCINAGVDVLMFANNVSAGDKIFTANEIHALIKKLVLENKISRARIDESYKRIMGMKSNIR